MAKPRKSTEKGARLGTSIRLDEDLKTRLDAIAEADEARLGFRPTLADVLRGCLRLGVEAREKEPGGKKR